MTDILAIARGALRLVNLDFMRPSTAIHLRAMARCEVHAATILDLVIRAELNEGRQPVFIQVGANDGVRDDDFRPKVVRFGLSGVLVEPQPQAFKSLMANYADVPGVFFENAAIAAAAGELTLYAFDGESEGDVKLDVFSSFSRAHLETAKRHLGLAAGITPLVVPAMTLEDVVAKHDLDRVSIFIIDTEGYDFEVVKLIDFERHRPLLIQFEHSALATDELFECYAFLNERGYDLLRSGGDTLALRAGGDS